MTYPNSEPKKSEISFWMRSDDDDVDMVVSVNVLSLDFLKQGSFFVLYMF